MNKLEIYKFQLETIQNALRLAIRTLNSKSKTTSMDRDLMQAQQYVNNALDGKIDEHVPRL